jgi:hypothetical protein
MKDRLLFLCTANSPYNGGLMMRMLPRVEATEGCFILLGEKTLGCKNWVS